MLLILAVLLLVIIVQSVRGLAARLRGVVSETTRDEELPADYGMNPERPWERRPRRRARLAA